MWQMICTNGLGSNRGIEQCSMCTVHISNTIQRIGAGEHKKKSQERTIPNSMLKCYVWQMITELTSGVGSNRGRIASESLICGSSPSCIQGLQFAAWHQVHVQFTNGCGMLITKYRLAVGLCHACTQAGNHCTWFAQLSWLATVGDWAGSSNKREQQNRATK